MRYASLGLLMLLILPACSKKPYEAEWERPDSALDPVGLSAHKQDARDRANQSKYKKGEKVTLRNSKTMVFEQNPETDYSVTGSPVSVDSGVVLEPGPLFVKVELKNGARGFINVSDIIDPAESSFGLLPVGANVELPSMPMSNEDMPAFLKAVEEMPGSSLEGGTSSGVLPANASPAKPQQPSAAPASAPVPAPASVGAPTSAPAPVVAPAAPKPQAKVEAPAPVAPPAQPEVKKAPAQADAPLPTPSAEATEKTTK